MTKILVVDDEQKIREMIRKYAEYEGFQVDEAADGLEAVQKADKNSYDVIVMISALIGLLMKNISSRMKAQRPSGSSAEHPAPSFLNSIVY